MDSVKYEKFTVATESAGEKKRETGKTSSLLVIGLALVVIALVAVAIAIGVGVGVSVSKDSGQSTASGLTVSTMTQEELQGEYYGSTGGIRFKVTVNDSFVYISVTTSSGDPVMVILNAVQSSMTMMGINSTNFLMMMNRPGKPKYVDYVIPENYTNMIESMMEGQEEMSDDVLELLDDKNVNETRQTSLENLVLSQAAVLIIEAAQALGSSGVIGTDYPPAMSFYLLAIQLAKIRDSMEGTNGFMLDGGATKTTERKRATQCSRESGGDVCARCPYSAYNNNCFGLCGRQCSCWTFICDDCCVHTYCETHDYCCFQEGFFSYACLSVAWKAPFSSCSSVYDC